MGSVAVKQGYGSRIGTVTDLPRVQAEDKDLEKEIELFFKGV